MRLLMRGHRLLQFLRIILPKRNDQNDLRIRRAAAQRRSALDDAGRRRPILTP